ncbi:MAG: phytanoyl-CoA dioxygenase family protein [Burkholderiales bacterium]
MDTALVEEVVELDRYAEGKRCPASMQADLRERFAREGYLHMPGLLSRGLVDDLSALLNKHYDDQAAWFLNEVGVRLDSPVDLKGLMDEQPDPEAWFLSQSRDIQHLIRGEFPLAVRMLGDFVRLTEEQALIALLRSLLGTTALRLNYPPMIRFKVPAMRQAEVPLHQDGPYFPHISNFATVWIPMCPITETCGGVKILEGSHRFGPLPHEDGVLWGKRLPREHLKERCVERHIEMLPGDVLIFGPNLVHYSHANTSDRVRCSIDSRWFGNETATTRQYYDLDTRRVVRMF